MVRPARLELATSWFVGSCRCLGSWGLRVCSSDAAPLAARYLGRICSPIVHGASAVVVVLLSVVFGSRLSLIVHSRFKYGARKAIRRNYAVNATVTRPANAEKIGATNAVTHLVQEIEDDSYRSPPARRRRAGPAPAIRPLRRRVALTGPVQSVVWADVAPSVMGV